ncbi:GDSL esterase/lipase [Acorus gramineus]|uniref:GDSL esterase/lipase n=1 Tax=Acorus gramineus TaxID=55184 RepID=A0AAV9BJS4_ACOGR|nr:GDSL esterase/lipase [Acorus gramineus]
MAPMSLDVQLGWFMKFLPSICESSASAQTLIEHGTQTMIVGGSIRLGCSPIYLTLYGTPNHDDYEPRTGCLKWANELSEYHDHLLQKEIQRARRKHSHATIAFADYYNILKLVYRSPNEYGFSSGRALIACCGGGGPYNVNMTNGNNGLSICRNPSSLVSWDGLHLTEAAYRVIARALSEGPYSVPPLA